MSRFFRWCMRHGAKILFAVALLQVAAALVGWLWLLAEAGRGWSSTGEPLSDNVLTEFATILYAVSGALLPFFGALVIDRLDRGLAAREAGEGGQ